MTYDADQTPTIPFPATPATVPLVHVIDPDEAVRDSLDLLLETSGFRVKSYRSSADFLGNPESVADACIVIDVGRTPRDGVPFLEALRQRKVVLPVIMLASWVRSEDRTLARWLGTDVVLEKPADPARLVDAVRRCLQSARLPRARGAGRPVAPSMPDMLTQREREVLRMALAGEPNKIIGRKLGISHRTVELHRSNILRKTGKSNMLQLASAFATHALTEDAGGRFDGARSSDGSAGPLPSEASAGREGVTPWAQGA